MNYEKIKLRFENSKSRFEEKKLYGCGERNCAIVKESDNVYAIRYYDTIIVRFFPDNTKKLYCGGFYTYTTKEKIKLFSNANLYQTNGVWYVGDSLFFDGITLDAKNKIISKKLNPAKAEKELKALKKRIKKYVNAFFDGVQKNGISEPGPGDCWFCSMRDQIRKKNLGDACEDYDHLESHIEESYFVPSLLYNALNENGMNASFFWYHLNSIQSIQFAQFESLAKRALYKYMLKRLQLKILEGTHE